MILSQLERGGLVVSSEALLALGPPPHAPANGRPGFSFGFPMGSGGRFRIAKARRGRVYLSIRHCFCQNPLVVT